MASTLMPSEMAELVGATQFASLCTASALLHDPVLCCMIPCYSHGCHGTLGVLCPKFS
jgi:hypothetical protein